MLVNVVVGEGYKEIVELYNNKPEYGVIRTESLIDVKDLPTVDWQKINPLKYRAHNWHGFGNLYHREPYGVVWTSLGCPYGCDFCCINNLFGKRTYRMRDMNKVVAEIDTLVSHGVSNIKILDELFIIDHPRIDQFCDLLEERNYDLNMWCFARVDTVSERILKRLKKVGMNWVAYGFESVSQKIIDSSCKNTTVKQYEETIRITKNAKINIIADVIAGFKEDDYDTLEEMYQFLVKHNFEAINLYPAFDFPGTPLYNGNKDWKTYSLYGDTCVPTGTDYLTPSEVVQWRDKKFIEYIKRP